ncbi:MAG TPA: class I SAM-dependent rRNA methyltransferase [Acidobacteriaceae bacterium]|nr:class I SAM-dependent rRNA methyltransferase [Acidobacteriaceae bacterium]
MSMLSATISRRAADRLRSGHLWVYRSDIERLPPETPGALVTLLDPREKPLGTALYSTASEIALRLISPEPSTTRAQYLADLRTRIESALHLRANALAPEAFAEDAATDACRLLFSEADNLPGIVADRYASLIILQLLTQGTAQDDVRRILVEVLSAHPWVHTIVERPDPRILQLEQLPPASPAPLFTRNSLSSTSEHLSLGAPHLEEMWERNPDLTITFSLNGLRFHYNANAGQKTGAFLDQRLNYLAAAHLAERSAIAHGRAGACGRGLDICTYQGGFALHLARACTHVTGVDASRAALEVADRNAALNPEIASKVDWIEADAFELLRDFSDRAAADPAARYDTIVLDPPAFAKSKRAAAGALRGYKELNLRALKMLTPGGALITCSCSHHVSLADFTEIVRSAAADTGRRVQLLETRGAAPDHPAILTLPETSYLKCLLLRVE